MSGETLRARIEALAEGAVPRRLAEHHCFKPWCPECAQRTQAEDWRDLLRAALAADGGADKPAAEATVTLTEAERRSLTGTVQRTLVDGETGMSPGDCNRAGWHVGAALVPVVEAILARRVAAPPSEPADAGVALDEARVAAALNEATRLEAGRDYHSERLNRHNMTLDAWNVRHVCEHIARYPEIVAAAARHVAAAITADARGAGS